MSPLANSSSDQCAVIHPAHRRGLPPSSWKWAPASVSLDFSNLPPLPTIRDSALAQQARMTKNYHGFMAGRASSYTYDDEIGCYRRLEWLGDAALHPAYAKHLYRLFPKAGSGVLSTVRGELHSNATQAHFAYAYELDLRLLEPPRPSNPRIIWTPLARNQNIIADIFEAHMGALAEEDREAEIVTWVEAVLDRNKERIRARVSELVARSNRGLALSTTENRKRSLEETNFAEGGYEMDPDTKRRRHSFLSMCPYSLDEDMDVPKWDDRPDGAGGWHSHLIFAGATVGCGGGAKRDPARQAAAKSFFQLARKEKNMLSMIFPELHRAGPCPDSAPNLADQDSTSSRR